MSKYTIDELKEHHYRCNGNREDLKIHERAGCFFCLKIFPASEVIHFVGDGYDLWIPIAHAAQSISPKLLRSARV